MWTFLPKVRVSLQTKMIILNFLWNFESNLLWRYFIWWCRRCGINSNDLQIFTLPVFQRCHSLPSLPTAESFSSWDL
jgi:hypothetical protein